jgi:hypothetical protein
MARDVEVIWVKRERKYFCKGGLDDPNHVDPVQQIALNAQGRLERFSAKWVPLRVKKTRQMEN